MVVFCDATTAVSFASNFLEKKKQIGPISWFDNKTDKFESFNTFFHCFLDHRYLCVKQRTGYLTSSKLTHCSGKYPWKW